MLKTIMGLNLLKYEVGQRQFFKIILKKVM